LDSAEGRTVRPWHTRSTEPDARLAALVPGAVDVVGVEQQHEERRRQAKEEVDQLREQIERVRQESFQAGVEAAGEQARKDAEAKVKPVLDQLAMSLAAMSALKTRLRKESELEILQLVLGVARRIVHREITIDPDAILGILQVGLGKISRRELHSIQAHPQHVGRIQAVLEGEGITNVEVTADPTLALGDVLFETSRGTLDARLETQFAEIENGLTDRI
jgi:flagellar assembly protein FliH